MIDPGFQVEVDRSTPSEWSQMLDQFSDANIYQTWSYGAVRWGRKNLSHLVLKRNGEVLGMAQVRIVRPTRFNFGMAYLRWGPLCHREGRELDAAAASYIARALQEEYVCKRGLLLQIIPNAFVDSTRAALFQSCFSKFTKESPTAANLYRTLREHPDSREIRLRPDSLARCSAPGTGECPRCCPSRSRDSRCSGSV